MRWKPKISNNKWLSSLPQYTLSHLKKILAILTLTLFSTTFLSGGTGDKNPDKRDKQSEKSTEESENQKTSEKEQETDSSLHSISKYNFLFYMVYKVKYGDQDSYSDSKSLPAEE